MLVIIAFPLFYFGKRVYTYVHRRHAEKQMEREILIRQAENEVLRARINEYKRGTVLEAKARDDLGMIKEGEQVYLVPGE
jgi:cell division protein FtsB